MKTANIDVLMPVYNSASYLSETLQSIQAQTVQNIRIIIVDDGSTDGTSEILAKAAAADSRIEIVTQANAGIVAALNAGLERCTAPFVARHDADDLSDPERFARQIDYLERHLDCVATSCMARHIDADGKPLGTITRFKDPDAADAWHIPAREPYLMHPFLTMRTEALKAVGGYRAVLGAEDSDLYWRLRSNGKLHNMRDVMGDYRMHAGSVSSQSIAHGRRLALGSQLAALSAQRREKGQPDIAFDNALLVEIKRTEELIDLYRIGCRFAEGEERQWLALALSIKIIELCFYRPFEPTAADIRFMCKALDQGSTIMTPQNAREVREFLIATATRLLLKPGYPRLALKLGGPKLVPVILARTAFRVALPDSLRTRIKRITGRSVAA
ncbi:glycosyltransferase [Kozakia baliensis]|uniref:glycosyltransferase family 2 protein n=1 Tax=Kozakia baliensis TaxID=153496 RepID=UPI00345BB91E